MAGEAETLNGSGDRYETVPLDRLIISDSNVRRRDIIADVDELARSIQEHGLQHPIVVQEKGDKFEIIIGQRRYLAYRELGRDAIPAKILAKPLDEMQAKVASFSENVQRRELAPRDKADACQYLLERLGSIRAVAEHLGVSEPTVRKWVGYAAVPETLKELVEQEKISRTQAVRLWETQQEEEKAVEIAQLIGERKPPRDEQRRILTAAEELPDRSVDVILRRAEELKHQTEITFILPEKWSRAIASAAEQLDKEPGEIARDATIEWLQRYEFFADR